MSSDKVDEAMAEVEAKMKETMAQPFKRSPVALVDPGWDDTAELQIAAWLAMAWLGELRRRRGGDATITADDIKQLRQAQAALRLLK